MPDEEQFDVDEAEAESAEYVPSQSEDIPFEEPEQPETPVSEALVMRPAGGIGLFGTGGPAEQLLQVEQAADVLKAFVKEHDLTLEMEDGTDYLTLPAWEGLGQILGVFAIVEGTEPIPGGWKARAIAKTRAGEVLTAREAICMRTELGRKYKPEFELQSMAETRACRKALQSALSIVVNAAGYDSAPLDERPMTPKQRAMLFAILAQLETLQPRGRDGWKDWLTDRTIRRFGKRISGLNRADARLVIDGMQRLHQELEEAVTGRSQDGDTAPTEEDVDELVSDEAGGMPYDESIEF